MFGVLRFSTCMYIIVWRRGFFRSRDPGTSTRLCLAAGLNHRSLISGHCFTFWKVTLTLNLANPRPKVGFRPRVSQIKDFGLLSKR